MGAVVCKSILYLLLTAGIQFVGLQFINWPDFDRGVLHIIFFYVLPVLLLVLACWQYCKIAGYKKRAWMVENPAAFSPELIDCYVRFTGEIAAERVYRLPLSISECAFYTAAVVAEWEAKKKKTGQGHGNPAQAPAA